MIKSILKTVKEVERLSFTVNAQCDMEEKKGKDLVKVMNDLENAKKRRQEDLRLIFHCIMLDNDEKLTVRESGKLLQAFGFKKFIELLPEIFEKAFPDPAPDTAGK